MGMNRLRTAIPAALAFFVVAACEPAAEPVDVYVPPSGDATRGKEVFLKYGCYNCHSIPGVELPERTVEPPMVFALGGRIHSVRGYGDLITSVMWPDHTVSPKFVGALKAAGEDPTEVQMPDFTDVMTVSEMVDLVEFLDAQYSRLLGTQYRGKGWRPRGRLQNVGED